VVEVAQVARAGQAAVLASNILNNLTKSATED
jgi:hypothetical protein